MWIKRRIIQYKFEYNNDFKNYYYKIDELKFENVETFDYICYEYCKLYKSESKFERLENTGVEIIKIFKFK